SVLALCGRQLAADLRGNLLGAACLMVKTSELWVWLALVITPILALTNLAIVYALVSPACEDQSSAVLHAVSIGSLALSLLLTIMAWRQWQKYSILPSRPEDDADARKKFLPAVASMAGLLTTLV